MQVTLRDSKIKAVKVDLENGKYVQIESYLSFKTVKKIYFSEMSVASKLELFLW